MVTSGMVIVHNSQVPQYFSLEIWRNKDTQTQEKARKLYWKVKKKRERLILGLHFCIRKWGFVIGYAKKLQSGLVSVNLLNIIWLFFLSIASAITAIKTLRKLILFRIRRSSCLTYSGSPHSSHLCLFKDLIASIIMEELRAWRGRLHPQWRKWSRWSRRYYWKMVKCYA